MITIDFIVSPEGFMVGFHASGHADFQNRGRDIVCAAASSAIYMTANTLTDVIRAETDIECSESGQMNLLVSNKDLKLAQDMLNGLKIHVLQLEEQYPKHIKVNLKEII